MKKTLINLFWYLLSIGIVCLIIGLWIYNYYYIDYSKNQEDYVPDYVTGQAIPN